MNLHVVEGPAGAGGQALLGGLQNVRRDAQGAVLPVVNKAGPWRETYDPAEGRRMREGFQGPTISCYVVQAC